MEEQRFPIGVRIIGVMHKEKSKMYMTSVLWSDQNDIVVYRTLQEYKEMHKSLKKAFPSAGKLKKSDRAVPKFPGRKMKQGRQKKGPAKSLLRLKVLQKYVNELLSCDGRVTQSSHLIQFFHPKDQDLLPEFSKNSILIMPTEGDVAGEVGSSGGNVTQPFVTETYRCMAQYETKDTKNKAFKVALDETVDVLIKDKAGWWLVENEEKRMAWFPAPYLERVDGDEDDVDGFADGGMMYTVIRNYKATKEDEITVSMGAVVEVLQRSENGWWFIRYNGKTGYIPTMYLQPYNHPHIRLTSQHPESRPSTPLLSPSSLSPGSLQLSHSQGNLLQLPSTSPSPARWPQPDSMHKSRSLNVLNEQQPPAKYSPPPTITVEMDGDKAQHSRSPSEDSDFAFTSDSDFSLSDDLSSSTASSVLNLSHSANGLRFSRTPEPTTSTHLSPTSAGGGRMIPSVSDPNLYKTPTTPKVPPRPRTQEILTRCTTITRKNASRATSPAPRGILVG